MISHRFSVFKPSGLFLYAMFLTCCYKNSLRGLIQEMRRLLNASFYDFQGNFLYFFFSIGCQSLALRYKNMRIHLQLVILIKQEKCLW